MPQIEKTTTITVDDTVFEVANMSETVQRLVSYLDEWRQVEADTLSKLLMVRGALRDIQNALLANIQNEQPSGDSQPAPPSTEE